jgi:hypothetical protein
MLKSRKEALKKYKSRGSRNLHHPLPAAAAFRAGAFSGSVMKGPPVLSG